VVIPHLVGNDVRGVRNDQLSRPRLSTWTPEVGILSQAGNGFANGSSDFSRGLGLVALDVGLNIGEVP